MKEANLIAEERVDIVGELVLQNEAALVARCDLLIQLRECAGDRRVIELGPEQRLAIHRHLEPS